MATKAEFNGRRGLRPAAAVRVLRASAIEHFQRVYSELTALHIELKESDIELDAEWIGLRHTVDQTRKIASALIQGMERLSER